MDKFEWDNRTQYAYWLANIRGIGIKTIEQLLVEVGDPRNVFELPPESLHEFLGKAQREEVIKAKEKWNGEDTYNFLKKRNIHFTTYLDNDYPDRLKRIPDAPFALYYIGRLPSDQLPTVAIIGARACSEYGKKSAAYFGGKLAEQGVQVISGFAYGIDSYGQNAAFKTNGSTFAVFGNGVDICYPAENRRLYNDIVSSKHGGLISEYPPGVMPKPQQFPPRNRIISGLADVVLVVEARRRSGTYITVSQALEQGKEVYAVPGRISDVLSEGCNFLISQGAGTALNAEVILKELENRECGNWRAHVENKQKTKETDLSEEEKLVMSVLDDNPKDIQSIWNEIHKIKEVTVSELLSVVVKLTVNGLVSEVGGEYTRK